MCIICHICAISHYKVLKLTSIEGEEESDGPRLSLSERRKSSAVHLGLEVDSDGLVVTKRRKSAIANAILGSKKSTKLLLVGSDNRVPFMALYQVCFECFVLSCV